MKRALIAMSGGVDSSVAAKKMIDMGYECIGCTMHLHDIKRANDDSVCGSGKDAEDAARVAALLKFPHYTFDLSKDFKKYVIDYFVSSYEKCETPNPCIECNRHLKFDALFKKAAELGCEYVVTGHYARVEKENGKYVLKKALDDKKDQSYVLYTLTQEKLKHIIFPLGEYKKTDVRLIASDNSFQNAAKPDSQDICFVPDGNYADIIKKYSEKESKKGHFVGKDGHIFGPNKGLINYTIGQRRGLGIAYTEPLFVTKLCPDTGDVILGANSDLMQNELFARDFNWILGEVPRTPFKCDIKIRYKSIPTRGLVTPVSDTEVNIVFDTPVRAITPGQSAVLYDGDKVLGGGIIR